MNPYTKAIDKIEICEKQIKEIKYLEDKEKNHIIADLCEIKFVVIPELRKRWEDKNGK